jgi:seryl-tRNA synthetase
MKGGIARLHRALGQFMLDTHTREHGYTEVYTPYMTTAACADGVTSFAKFKDDQFKIEGPRPLPDPYLGIHGHQLRARRDRAAGKAAAEILLPFAVLPLGGGAAGKDTRGMIRNHQFDKVELVQIVHPSKSWEAHEQLTGHAEAILKKLELPTAW